MIRPTKVLATNYVVTDADEVILVDASASPGFWFVNLPSPVGRLGATFTIRKIDATKNAVRVQFGGPFTVDGILFPSNRISLSVQWESFSVVSDGANWQRTDQWTANISGFNPANVQPGRAYVSGHYGNDAYTGLVPWQAKKTIMAAMAIPTVTEIRVDRGTYTEAIVMVQGKKLVGGPDVTIRAPSANADVVKMSVGNELSHLKLMGFNGPNWTGRCIVIEGGSGYNYVHDVQLGNNEGYLPRNYPDGMDDPGYGGTGIFIRDSEFDWFENYGIGSCRIGIDINDTGNGCSMLSFRRCHLVSCWKELVIGGAVGHFVFENFKSSGAAGFHVARQYGYIWDVALSGGVFVNCDFSEYAKSNARFWLGPEYPNDPPVNDNRGGNTFINCTTSLQCKLYIESHRNRFENFYAQNDLVLNGNWNEIDGIYTTGGGNVIINGRHNSIRRHYRESGSANQIKITDNGQGTMIDGVTLAVAPPTTGHGWRKGRILTNSNPVSGAPMGWMCTVEALGPPQPQGGQWVPLAAIP